MSSDWISYNELAWTEEYLADQKEYEIEAKYYIDLIKKYSSNKTETLLHFGCGAGGQDTFLKNEFKITGVDLSKGMLKIARERHPDIEYIEADMKRVKLDRRFDIVFIPDSIDYMATEDDLSEAITNSAYHLNPGGLLIITAKTKEKFQNNNFAYTVERGDVHVTLLENNYDNRFKQNTYEASLMYLIRKRGELSIRTENQVLGLFPEAVWEKLFRNAGFSLQTETLTGSYDKYLLNQGEYTLTIFIGQKPK